MEYDLNLDPANFVYSHSRAVSEHPLFEIAAAVDSSLERRTVFEQVYGLPSYNTVAKALAGVDVDLAIIATPTSSHLKVLEEILANSAPKIILCEKPLSYDLADAKRMIDICEKAGITLFVNYMRRVDAGVIEVKRRIDSGQLKTPMKGVAWYSKGYFHNGSHMFNLLEFWLGSYASSTLISQGRLWDGIDPEPDLLIEFEGGSVVFRSAWEEAYSHYTIELLSDSGRLRYEAGGELIEMQSVESGASKELSRNREYIATSMNKYQLQVFEQIAHFVAGVPVTLCTGLEAYTTLESMHESLVGSDL